MKRYPRAWNGGSREAAMEAAQKAAEAAIASGCHRCPTCNGKGLLPGPVICARCGAAGYLVPAGGMPKPWEQLR